MASTKLSKNLSNALPKLTQTLLNYGRILPSDKYYKTLRRNFRDFQETIKHDLGIDVVPAGEEYRILSNDQKTDQPVFETVHEYAMYACIGAILAGMSRGETITQDELGDIVTNAITMDIEPDERNSRFKKALRHLINNGTISSENKQYSDDYSETILTKKSDLHLVENNQSDAETDSVGILLNHLITKPSLEIAKHKRLLDNVELEDLRERLNKYSNEDNGYELFVTKTHLRLIQYGSSKSTAFPYHNLKRHLVACDISGKHGDVEQLVKDSKYATAAIKDDYESISEIIDAYDLKSANIVFVDDTAEQP